MKIAKWTLLAEARNRLRKVGVVAESKVQAAARGNDVTILTINHHVPQSFFTSFPLALIHYGPEFLS